MTPSENIKHEAAEITGRLGYYIPPYRLSSLMKTAQRITDLLTRSDVCMSYAECQITMTYDTAGAEAKINVSATHTSLNPTATSTWIMCEALISYIRESFEYKAF